MAKIRCMFIVSLDIRIKLTKQSKTIYHNWFITHYIYIFFFIILVKTLIHALLPTFITIEEF